MTVGPGDLTDPLDVRGNHLERLLEPARLPSTQAVVQLVLGEDQPDGAIAGGDPLHRAALEIVLLAAETVADVRGDNGDPVAGVQLVEEVEGLMECPLAHVRDIDQNPPGDHGLNSGPSELGEALLRLGKQQSVKAVREEREGRCIGSHLPPQEVGQGDVDDAAPGELFDAPLDLGPRRSQVKATLDAVNKGDLPGVQSPVELGRRVGDDSPVAVRWG